MNRFLEHVIEPITEAWADVKTIPPHVLDQIFPKGSKQAQGLGENMLVLELTPNNKVLEQVKSAIKNHPGSENYYLYFRVSAREQYIATVTVATGSIVFPISVAQVPSRHYFNEPVPHMGIARGSGYIALRSTNYSHCERIVMLSNDLNRWEVSTQRARQNQPAEATDRYNASTASVLVRRKLEELRPLLKKRMDAVLEAMIKQDAGGMPTLTIKPLFDFYHVMTDFTKWDNLTRAKVVNNRVSKEDLMKILQEIDAIKKKLAGDK